MSKYLLYQIVTYFNRQIGVDTRIKYLCWGNTIRVEEIDKWKHFEPSIDTADDYIHTHILSYAVIVEKSMASDLLTLVAR